MIETAESLRPHARAPTVAPRGFRPALGTFIALQR